MYNIYQQYGGGSCSLCKSPNTTKVNCPLNKDAANPSFEKHPLARELMSVPDIKLQPSEPNKTTDKPINKPIDTPKEPIPTTKEQKKAAHKRTFINVNPKPCLSAYDYNYDKLSNDLLSKHSPEKDGDPTLIMMMGLPGSGKTSGISTFIQESGFTKKDFVLIGLDEMSLSLPEYQYGLNLPLDTVYEPDDVVDVITSYDLLSDSLSTVQLYNSCSGPARRLVRMMVEKALQRGYNVIYDGTGQEPNIYDDLIYRSKSRNYKTILIYVNNTLDTVWSRVRERAGKTGRYVPKSVVANIQQALDSILPFDNLCDQSDICLIYDNTKKLEKVLVVDEKHKVHCLNKGLATTLSHLC